MPANNKFDKISLKVTDIAGTQIEQRQNLLPGKIIQLGSEYKAGTYFVELRQGMNVKVIKVVKQ